MNQGSAFPKDIHTNPVWLIQDYLEIPRRFLFVRLEESQYREISFLDHRIGDQLKGVFPVSFADLGQAFPSGFTAENPAAYIFQIGHCGSTLISRIMGGNDKILPVREPQTLFALAKSYRTLHDPLSWLSAQEWQRLKTIILLSLERRFRMDQLPVIKANSQCNNLLEPVLDSHPARRSILMHIPLEAYLAGMLQYKDVFGDIRSQSQTRLAEWHQLTGSSELRLAQMRAEGLIVLSWLGSMARFDAAEQKHPEQILRLDFEDFLAEPEETLGELAGFLRLDQLANKFTATYKRISNSYSKDPRRSYSSEIRNNALDESRSKNAHLIQQALSFAERLVSENPSMSNSRQYFKR